MIVSSLVSGSCHGPDPRIEWFLIHSSVAWRITGILVERVDRMTQLLILETSKIWSVDSGRVGIKDLTGQGTQVSPEVNGPFDDQ